MISNTINTVVRAKDWRHTLKVVAGAVVKHESVFVSSAGCDGNREAFRLETISQTCLLSNVCGPGKRLPLGWLFHKATKLPDPKAQGELSADADDHVTQPPNIWHGRLRSSSPPPYPPPLPPPAAPPPAKPWTLSLTMTAKSSKPEMGAGTATSSSSSSMAKILSTRSCGSGEMTGSPTSERSSPIARTLPASSSQEVTSNTPSAVRSLSHCPLRNHPRHKLPVGHPLFRRKTLHEAASPNASAH